MKDTNKVNENGSITIYDKFEDPTSALEKLGNWFARSGMYGVEKVEQGIVLGLHCVSQKKDPLDLVRTHHMIGGRLSMRADAMLAGYRERGGRVKWVQFDDEAAVADWTFEGETTRIGFTMEEAQKANLVRKSGPWLLQPAAMLRARCISKAIRMLAPEVNCGFYSPEEVQDMVPAPVVEAKALFAKPAKAEVIERKEGK